jgi:NAD-dependent protein deacetylase/lipoamidase
VSVAGEHRGAAGQPAARRTSAQAERLAQLLRDARRAVVLTGAGVSVPSGIPDFRSPGTGLWEKVDPMEVAHIDAWRRDPDRFWSFYADRFASLVDKQPNEAHLAIAELERRGLVEAVITQNIDRLHRVAGTRRLIEVHGSIEHSVCLECHGRLPLERVIEQLAAGDGAPECPACIAPLKPDVVLFGELLPERAMSEAQALALDADLMVCIGSSLEVYPVAGLPAMTRGGGGGRLALVTQGPTPYDADAEVKLDGDVVEELRAVLAAL